MEVNGVDKAYSLVAEGELSTILSNFNSSYTYDVVDDASGKPVKMNVKTSNFITDNDVLSAVSTIEYYSQSVVDSIEE